MQAVLTKNGFDEQTQQALRAANLNDQQIKEVLNFPPSAPFLKSSDDQADFPAKDAWIRQAMYVGWQEIIISSYACRCRFYGAPAMLSSGGYRGRPPLTHPWHRHLGERRHQC